MGGSTLREMFVALGIDADAASFAQAQAAVDAIEKGLDKIVSAAKAVAQAFVDTVVNTAQQSGEISRLSQRLGVTTDTVQEFQYAAKRSGLSTEELVIAMGHLSRETLKASEGGEAAKQAFAQLGVHTRDASGEFKASDVLLEDLADSFQKMPDGQKKAALAMDVFGRAGAALIPFLDRGRAGIEDLRKEAHELGVVLDSEAIAQGKRFNGNIAQLDAVVMGFQHTLAVPLIEALNPILERFGTWIRLNREFIRQRIEQVAKLIGRALTALSNVLATLMKVTLFVVDHWKLFAAIIGGVALAAVIANAAAIAEWIAEMVIAGATAIATGAAAAASWLAAVAPVALLGLLFAGLLLILDDVRGYLEGEDSLIGRIGPAWTKFMENFTLPRGNDPWWLAVLKRGLRLVTDLQLEVPRLIDELEGLATPAGVLGTLMRAREVGIARTANEVIGGGATSPQAAADIHAITQRGAQQANTFQTNVTIHASPAQSPGDIASAVVKQIDEHHKARLREAAVATGG